MTPDLSDGDLFIKIKEKGNQEYQEQLKHKMANLAFVKGSNLIFFLDKIIYPETIDDII